MSIRLIIEKFKKFINHNPWIVAASILAGLLLIWLAGCESTGPSPMDPSRQINRTELELEVKMFMAKVETADTTIATKEKLRDLFLSQALVSVSGESLNYFSLITSIMSIMGIGSVLDNRRKDSIIKIKKAENANLKNGNRTN